MQIKKYTKGKNNTYIVTIDNDNFLLYDDVIVKHELLLKKEITKEKLESLLKEQQELESYYEAIRYLKRKMRTKKEIKEYLKKKEFSIENIDNTIKKLEKENIINENAYIDAFIHDELLFTLDGPKKILTKLEKLGLPKEYCLKKLENVDNWEERCLKLLNKKISSMHKESSKAKELKATNFLIQNGYELKMIKENIDKIEIKTDKKEIKSVYEKIKRRLERKYDKDVLEKKIIDKLKSLGYTNEEIEQIDNNFSQQTTFDFL